MFYFTLTYECYPMISAPMKDDEDRLNSFTTFLLTNSGHLNHKNLVNEKEAIGILLFQKGYKVNRKKIFS